jgi:hypothetical protein
MAEWTISCLLHNLSIRKPIENRWVAIVPKTDQRIQELISQYPTVKNLVNGFTNQFGRPHNPSVILVRVDSPGMVSSSDAVIGLRNAVAVCCVIGAWVDLLNRGWRLPSTCYSDYFDVYPILPSRDHEHFLTFSPDMWGIDEAKEFAGQTSPGLATPVTNVDYNSRLLEAILSKWECRYVQGRTSEWQTTALFRSLEMAYQACSMPVSNQSTIYDYGSRLALWVSAFEIMVHPEREQANEFKVRELIGMAPLHGAQFARRQYAVTGGKKVKRLRVTLLQKLYHEIYTARNDFLHGNPVSARCLHPFGKTSRFPLNYFAPLLYSIALICHLDIQDYYKDANGLPMDDYMVIRGLEEGLLKATVDRPKKASPA